MGLVVISMPPGVARPTVSNCTFELTQAKCRASIAVTSLARLHRST